MFIENKVGQKVCYWPDDGFGAFESFRDRKERLLRKRYPDLQKAYDKYLGAKLNSKEEKKLRKEYKFLLKMYWDYD